MPGMISIHGPRGGKYLVEFRTDDGRALGLFVPASHAEVLRELQEAMPYGLLVRDVDARADEPASGEYPARALKKWPRWPLA
jgi:hypothetical protein